MNYWVITDTHLGHDLIQEHCQRPPGFEEIVLLNILQLVKPDDVLIHLGDVCFYRDEYWHQRLREACRGKRWLLLGNHDRKSRSWYLSHGWDFVADEMTIKLFGKRLVFSHRPIPARDDFDLNIHGHLHNSVKRSELVTPDKHRLIFIEHTYTPVDLRKIVERPKSER